MNKPRWFENDISVSHYLIFFQLSPVENPASVIQTWIMRTFVLSAFHNLNFILSQAPTPDFIPPFQILVPISFIHTEENETMADMSVREGANSSDQSELSGQQEELRCPEIKWNHPRSALSTCSIIF